VRVILTVSFRESYDDRRCAMGDQMEHGLWHDAASETRRPEKSGMDSERERARKRVERKNKFRADVVAYFVINAFLIGVWAFTDAGYFWPGWVLAGWGVMLLLDAWNVYFRRPVTDDDIDHEMRARH
jgi:hypothetical protein